MIMIMIISDESEAEDGAGKSPGKKVTMINVVMMMMKQK